MKDFFIVNNRLIHKNLAGLGKKLVHSLASVNGCRHVGIDYQALNFMSFGNFLQRNHNLRYLRRRNGDNAFFSVSDFFIIQSGDNQRNIGIGGVSR